MCVMFGGSESKNQISFSSGSSWFKVATVFYLLLTCGLMLMSIRALLARLSVLAIRKVLEDTKWNSLHATYQLKSIFRLLLPETVVFNCSYMVFSKINSF